MIERKIGDVLTLHFRAEETDKPKCEDCDFYDSFLCILGGQCRANNRSDGKNIIFKLTTNK